MPDKPTQPAEPQATPPDPNPPVEREQVNPRQQDRLKRTPGTKTRERGA